MESVHFRRDTTSSGFSPKFGSKEKKSLSVEELLSQAKAFTANLPSKPTRRYSSELPRPKEHTYRCKSCGKAEVVRPFILPVGWYTVGHKVSGDIMDGKYTSAQFCSKECLINAFQ